MITGALVGESLQPGARLDGLELTARRIERLEAGLGDQPPIWTLLWLEAPEAHAELLATALTAVLQPRGGW